MISAQAKIRGYFNLLGLQRLFAGILASLLGLALVEASFSIRFFFPLIITFFLWSSTCVINNIYDLDIDKVSKPDRPLPSGIITRKEAFSYAIMLYIGALISLILLNNLVVWIISLIYLVLGIVYSVPPFRARDTVFKNAIVGVASSLPFLISAYMFGDASLYILFSAVALYLWPFFASIERDLPDYESELKAGLRTIPVVLGLRRTALLSLFIPISHVIFALSMYLLHLNFGIVLFLIGLALVQGIIVLRFVKKVHDLEARKGHWRKSIALCSLAMIVICGYQFYTRLFI